jgi:hypothetical protein
VQVTPDGIFFSDKSHAFAYYTSTLVKPASGPITGGTQLTIRGPHLSGATHGGVLCRLEATTGEAISMSGVLIQRLELGAGSSATRFASAVHCLVPESQSWLSLAATASARNVTVAVSLHGVAGLTSSAQGGVVFTMYRDPILSSAQPSFASTGGGVAVTIRGSGFLATAHLNTVLCRFTKAHMHMRAAPMRALVLSDSMLICNASRLCSASAATSRPPEEWPFVTSAADYPAGRCDNEGLNASDVLGSVELALNGQQFANNNGSVPFIYYFANAIEPSGGSLEGGTTVTIFGNNFNSTGTRQFKCRFSHNMFEVQGHLLPATESLGLTNGVVAIVCVSPQGREFSTVQICVGTPFSATDHLTMGCKNGWTSNSLLFFHYSLYPLIYIRPVSGPSIGKSLVVVHLAASQYVEGYTSGQQFRAYSRAGVMCRFGAQAVAGTVENATHILCTSPSNDVARGGKNMKVGVSISLNGGQEYSLTNLVFTYHVITSISPMMRPSRCASPNCVRYTSGGAVLTCDWCREYPQVCPTRIPASPCACVASCIPHIYAYHPVHIASQQATTNVNASEHTRKQASLYNSPMRELSRVFSFPLFCESNLQVDSQSGYCSSWDDIYVKGLQAPQLSVTVRGTNLFFDQANLADGGKPYPRCRLGALNVFNATLSPLSLANTLDANTLDNTQNSQLVCTLPTRIYQSSGALADATGAALPVETPSLVLEVSINGRDWTDRFIQFRA